MANIYEFTEDEVETGREWWMELEEGSLSLQMNGSKFDSCLLVNLERDPSIGFVVANVATEKGTESVRLSLKHFSLNKNEFCEMFQEKTFSRTLFLEAFNKYKSGTERKRQSNELSACSETSPTENVKEAGSSRSCQIAPETSNLDVPEEDDNCTSTTLDKHKVADSIKVRISLLQQPSKGYQVRDVDENHTKQLQEEMLRNPESRYLKMLIHIPDTTPTKVDIAEINSGLYTLEVIGGNHTRLALQTMQGLSPTECVDAIVYAGLSRNQALCLGVMHNEGHQMAKAMSFSDYVYLCRRIWTSITANVETPTNTERKRLKDTLSDMFRLPKKQIGTKFRHHIYLATLDNDVWSKTARFMVKWEERKITGQPLKPLTQFNTAVLEKIASKNELTSVLTQLLEGKVTWPDIRHQVENRRQEPKVKTDGKPCCQDEVLQLKSEVESLKRKNAELELEVTALKQKITKMRDSGITTTSPSSEKKKTASHEDDIRKFKDGEWIGVLFNSKCFLGRVLEVGNGWVRTQFLTSRTKGKLNKKDIQQVESRFIICKVKSVEEKDGVYFMPKDEEQVMEEEFKLYKEKYL